MALTFLRNYLEGRSQVDECRFEEEGESGRKQILLDYIFVNIFCEVQKYPQAFAELVKQVLLAVWVQKHRAHVRL